ncbi:hypothetical protein QTP88_023570 [Uroleucon formosanum]
MINYCILKTILDGRLIWDYWDLALKARKIIFEPTKIINFDSSLHSLKYV